MRMITQIIFFIASYSPLLFLVALKSIEEFSIESINKIITDSWLIIIVIVFSVLYTLWWTSSAKEFKKIEEINLEKQNYELLNYIITYMIPLITFDIEEPGTILMNAVLFMIILMFYLRDDNLHMSMILFFLGYNLYKSDSHIYLSKNTYSELNYFDNEYASINGSKYRILRSDKDSE